MIAPSMMDEISEIENALDAAGVIAPKKIGSETLSKLPGLTNRTWRVVTDAGSFVVRLPGSGTQAFIDRASEAYNLRIAEASGVAAPVIHVGPQTGVLVMRFLDAATVPDAAYLRRGDTIARLGRTLRTLHDGRPFHGVMNPFDKIDHYLATAGLDDPAAETAFGTLWPAVLRLRDTVAFDTRDLKPCHVDPVAANMLDTPEGLLLIDWEYAAMSVPIWDLAYAAVEAGFDEAQKAELLAAYGDGHGGGRGEGDGADLAVWCAVAMAVTVAWCLMQRVLSHGDVDFQAYADRRMAGLADGLAAL